VLARKYQLLEGTPPIAADLIDKLCVLEPSARLGGAWSVEADTTDPSKLSGIEPRLLGHAALRAHPFFEGLPATDLHLFPVPQPTAEEIEMNELVRKIGTEGIDAVFGATEADRTAAVASWSDDFKLAMAFETGKRDLLSNELRDIFGMPAPPPPIVDDLTEELGADQGAEADGADAADDDDNAGEQG
jgi:hypothetical protein